MQKSKTLTDLHVTRYWGCMQVTVQPFPSSHVLEPDNSSRFNGITLFGRCIWLRPHNLQDSTAPRTKFNHDTTYNHRKTQMMAALYIYTFLSIKLTFYKDYKHR